MVGSAPGPERVPPGARDLRARADDVPPAGTRDVPPGAALAPRGGGPSSAPFTPASFPHPRLPHQLAHARLPRTNASSDPHLPHSGNHTDTSTAKTSFGPSSPSRRTQSLHELPPDQRSLQRADGGTTTGLLAAQPLAQPRGQREEGDAEDAFRSGPSQSQEREHNR